MNKNLYLFDIPRLSAYVVISGVLALTGSVLLLMSAFVADMWWQLEWISENSDASFTAADTFGYIVFAPVVETYMIVCLVWVLAKLNLSHIAICVSSALVWAGLHGLLNPLSSIGTIFSFFIFTHSYLVWKKHSFKRAYLAAALPHVMVNTAVVVLGFAIS